MKKSTALIASALLIISFAGCRNSSSSEPSSEKATDSFATQANTEKRTTNEIIDIAESSSNDISVDSSEHKVNAVEITLSFNRASTHASNQVAVWVEDADQKLIKTVYVSNFTSSRRGYEERENTLSHWVSAAKPENMNDEEIDAISSATLSSGSNTITWDMTDSDGNRVPDGIYTLKIEGTLYWESNILYTAIIDTNSEEKAVEVQSVRSNPEISENENMIEDVSVKCL